MRSGGRLHATVAVATAAGVLLACDENDLGIEKRRPNDAPQTIISASPGDSTRTDYRVGLSWWGSDPDGSVDHFDFILVDHPHTPTPDSTGAYVTVPEPYDPRWVGTTATDTVLVTLADTLRADPAQGFPENMRQRQLERWHTFFVRAVDDVGTPDATPDYVTFNSTNLAPIVSLERPVRAGGTFDCPPTVVLRWNGTDPLPHGESRDPVASRWLLVGSNSGYSGWPSAFYNAPESAWSEWKAWDFAGAAGVSTTLRGMTVTSPRSQVLGYYMFAVQALDEAGAVTSVFDMSTPDKNNAVRIRVSGRAGPWLMLDERFLGAYKFVGNPNNSRFDVGVGQPIEFTWVADASSYGATIMGYRYGWNILDPTNDADWEQSWALGSRRSPLRHARRGSDRFYLQAVDSAGNITSVVVEIFGHELTMRRDVLWVDDTEWTGTAAGTEVNEDERQLAVLAGSAATHGYEFVPQLDVYDVVQNNFNAPSAALAFDYKAIVWTVIDGLGGRSGLRSLALFSDPFAPPSTQPQQFNWINVYLQQGGKLWLSGHRPAQQVWSLNRAAGRDLDPVNVTHWVDPSASHPLVDSVGTTSLLYAMRIEMFDMGGGAGSRREQPRHFCAGVAPAAPPELAVQTFTSSPAAGHTHTLAVHIQDVNTLVSPGRTLQTSVADGHAHAVFLSTDDQRALQAGRAVHVETDAAGPEPHVHAFDLVDGVGLWGVPILIPGGDWSPVPGIGRPNVEIYNMAGAMTASVPPLHPIPGTVLPIYTYVSGVPANPSTGTLYPLTADRQAVVVLGKRSPEDALYSTALCGFPVFSLLQISHGWLTDYVLARHFGLARTPSPTPAASEAPR
jgi:hypothetical protein